MGSQRGSAGLLFIDRRDDVAMKGKPQAHALVVGISEYPNLGGLGATVPPDARTLRLGQLTIAARTAYAFASWLRRHQDDSTPRLPPADSSSPPRHRSTSRFPN